MYLIMGVLWGNRQMVAGIMPQILLCLAFFIRSYAKPNLAAHFIFGDSLLDVGNNNYILTVARGNYDFNGIDFGKPTGRYTNGRTIADIIGEELGMKDFIPPYLAPTTVGSVILKGVNYASGAAGILNETGKIWGGQLNMDAQVDYFANTRQDIITRIGASAAENLLNNALFTIVIGSNDFLFKYILDSQNLSPEIFVCAVVSRFKLQLTRLYSMGARKIVVSNIGPIGCIPLVRDLYNPTTDDGCVAFLNQLAQSFNSQLKSLIMEFTANLEGSKFLYADAYGIVDDLFKNYVSYGFENANSACCSIAGNHGGLIPCFPVSKLCDNRSKYVFWDPFHPSDAANVIIAKRMLYGATDDMFPMNIIQLLES